MLRSRGARAVQLLLIVVCVNAVGCATVAEPVDLPEPVIPRPPDGAMVACSEGLVPARDATRQAVLAARAATADRYETCRLRHEALRIYIRELRGSGSSAVNTQ